MAIVPDINDEHPHPYIGGTPGCWQIYSEVLRMEFQDPSYFQVHRLTVDTYAVQHPGKDERRGRQSVIAHLVSLYCVLVLKSNHKFATEAIRRVIDLEVALPWLSPPINRGHLTVADVAVAATSEKHIAVVSAWAKCVWDSWSAHHRYIADLVEKCRF